MTKFTERDREVLGDLVFAYDQHCRINPAYAERGLSPLDCGGSNGSDHSYRLTKLVRLGYAEHRKFAEWGKASTKFRGSKKYRPTIAGREALK
jgi:hypothetical protein